MYVHLYLLQEYPLLHCGHTTGLYSTTHHSVSLFLSLTLSLTLSLPVSLYLVRVRARTFFLSLSRHLIFPSIHTLRVRVCTWVVCAFVRVWLFHWQRAHELSEVLRFCRRHASGPVCNCFDLSFDAKHNMFIYVHIAPRSCVVSSCLIYIRMYMMTWYSYVRPWLHPYITYTVISVYTCMVGTNRHVFCIQAHTHTHTHTHTRTYILWPWRS